MKQVITEYSNLYKLFKHINNELIDVTSVCGLGSENCCRSKVEKRLLFRTYQNVTSDITKITRYLREDFNNYDTLIGLLNTNTI